MTMKRILANFLFLSTFASPLFAWSAAPCDGATLAKRAAFAAKVRSAKPGNPVYVRLPFPKTNDDVIADLVEQFVSIYDGHPSRFSAISDAMKRGAIRYAVARVEDWTPARCASAGNFGDFYWLLVLHDASTGSVVARARVFESGLLGDLALTESVEAKQELPDAGPALSSLKAHGVNARDAQLVTINGTLNCHELIPCVASRDENGLYLQHGNELYVLPAGGRNISFRNELAGNGQMKRAAEKLAADERFVSIGGDAFVVAKRIK
jgi:hypothetical protein